MSKYNLGKWLLMRQIFAVSVVIQAASWTILSLVCIVLHYVKPSSIQYFEKTVMSDQTPFIDLISASLYGTLLDGENKEINRILVPRNFHIIVWIYAFLSIVWLGLAISECLVVFKKRVSRNNNYTLLSFGIVTIITCLFDTIVFSLAFADYLDINPFDYTIVQANQDNYDFSVNIDLQLRYFIGRKISYGVLITLLARGFVLWILNGTAGSFCVALSLKMFRMPPILQYNDVIPRPKLNGKKPERVSSVYSNEYASPEYLEGWPRSDQSHWQHFPANKRQANGSGFIYRK